uniref:Secreted protein n=1 Tax=Physcomitrium patens TaxID=3218 RepID=A0A2K1IHW7_PHYPA|nr:hypothetical protein PHYPA_027552 [Physcomitrium patens]
MLRCSISIFFVWFFPLEVELALPREAILLPCWYKLRKELGGIDSVYSGSSRWRSWLSSSKFKRRRRCCVILDSTATCGSAFVSWFRWQKAAHRPHSSTGSDSPSGGGSGAGQRSLGFDFPCFAMPGFDCYNLRRCLRSVEGLNPCHTSGSIY